jgi:hypothetical protein
VKKIFVKMMFFVCLGSSATAFCGGVKYEKCYITMDQLWIDDSGMFVNLGGDVKPIRALYRDENGLYLKGPPDPKGWWCKKCETTHGSRQRCPYDEKPPQKTR